MPVTCPHCSRHFPNSDTINSRHKAVCPGWQTDEKPRPCLCGHEATSLTQMKRHRQQCPVWKARHRGTVQMERLAETLQANHGVSRLRDIPEAEARRKATLQARYGADNVFSRDSAIFDKVQASLEGKRSILRGQANPFADPAVQEKIRQTNLVRLGVENPQQSPKVRTRTRTTNLVRYGTEETLAAPVIRERIVETNRERYGGPAPACSPGVVEKVRQTNLSRWGVEWTSQHPDVRQRQVEAEFEHYGTWFLASAEGKETVRQILLEKYGVEHPLQNEAIYQKLVETSLARYGFNHAMKNPDVARRALEAAARPGPNRFEAAFGKLFPQLVYTGNGTFWRWLPALGHHKNPDFILPGLDPRQPKKGITKVVELFGDYWHSRMFTGKANFAHESDLVAAWAGIGVECLIVWESEFKADPEDVRAKVSDFLS